MPVNAPQFPFARFIPTSQDGKFLRAEMEQLAKWLTQQLSQGVLTAAEIEAIVNAIISGGAKIKMFTQAVSVSSTGSLNIAISSAFNFFRYKLDVGAGAGAYNYDLQLTGTGRTIGDWVIFDVYGPLSANPTLRFFDQASAVKLLDFTFYPAKYTVSEVHFFWDGTQWQLGGATCTNTG
jgi:hypothetical protein